ncbi:MAG: HEAT repeat domain-containing protein [Armatimonadetes bacterium]|jgi:HEAT repeat protein|nr:HEAT repeat domain-containing protein [Armatimonadota bacterium]
MSEHIQRALQSRRIEERLGAVEALARLEPAEATPLLLQALRDRSRYVAAQAARVLGEQRNDEAVPEMVAHFCWLSEEGKVRDPGCRVRNELAVAFGKLDDARATDALFLGMRTVQVEQDGVALVDMATGLRGNCALALAQLRPPGALYALSLLLFDLIPTESGFQWVEPTRAAAEALGHLGDPAGMVPLALRLAGGIALRSDGPTAVAPGLSASWLPTAAPAVPPPSREQIEPDLVVACMNAAVTLDPEQAVPLVAPYLRACRGWEVGDDEPGHGGARAYLCGSAALALARTRRPEVLPLLRECLETGPDTALEAVAIALGNLRSDEARAALMEAASNSRASVRAAAAAALALFPDEEVLALLRRLAQRDKAAKVREAARRALP